MDKYRLGPQAPGAGDLYPHKILSIRFCADARVDAPSERPLLGQNPMFVPGAQPTRGAVNPIYAQSRRGAVIWNVRFAAGRQ